MNIYRTAWKRQRKAIMSKVKTSRSRSYKRWILTKRISEFRKLRNQISTRPSSPPTSKVPRHTKTILKQIKLTEKK